jgi:hypothetical protein
MTLRPSSAAAWFAAGVKPGIRQAGDVPRWARCVEHRGKAVEPFGALHFGEKHRRILLIGGAGFDPRSLVVPRLLASVAPGRVDGLFLRERRPNPNPGLLTRADGNIHRLAQLIDAARFEDVSVFESDGAVAIGRRVVDVIRGLDLSHYTDVITDFSALSIGSSFPVARFLLERLDLRGPHGSAPPNLHAMVTASPITDDRIIASPSEVVQPIHGFQGRLGIDETVRAARLWIPQLRFGQSGILELIYDELKPDDVVPVLPFPAHDPRLGDRLIEHYAEDFDGRWGVDARSIVYADEYSPLDFYRTVLRIDDGRHPVFASTGGDLVVLSPIGSKVLALGAMMAASERDLPVLYVEALSYSSSLSDGLTSEYSFEDLVHVWLSGEAYPSPVTPGEGAKGTS